MVRHVNFFHSSTFHAFQRLQERYFTPGKTSSLFDSGRMSHPRSLLLLLMMNMHLGIGRRCLLYLKNLSSLTSISSHSLPLRNAFVSSQWLQLLRLRGDLNHRTEHITMTTSLSSLFPKSWKPSMSIFLNNSWFVFSDSV